MSNQQPDDAHLQSLQQLVGASNEKPKVRCGPGTDSKTQAELEMEEMKLLQAAGADYGGMGLWQRLMQKVGRI